MTSPEPEVIGVLDLQQGRVVHAVAGQRNSYKPLQLPNGSGDIVEIAQQVADANDVSRFYIADLDALESRPRQWNVIRQLAESFPIAVDAGFRSLDDVAELTGNDSVQPIIALESWLSPDELPDIVAAFPQAIFSLDLMNGRPRAAGQCWPSEIMAIAESAIAAGIETILVLDVSTVGRGQGLANESLCRAICDAWPDVRLWTGGGLTLSQSEIATAKSLGIEALLVGTKLFERAGLRSSSA